MLLTSDLRALGHILHRSDVYEKPMAMRVAYSHIMGWGVLTSEGEHHRLQRKALNPAFGAAHIRNLTGIFLDKANQVSTNHGRMSFSCLPKHDVAPGCLE
jgi:cytochrome P450